MKNLFRLLVCCTLLLVNACGFAQTQGLTPEAFDAQLKAHPDAQLLDVRTPEEYDAGHIKGAMQANIQKEQEFIRRAEALDPKKPVLVYCLSGGRSQAATNWLQQHGYNALQLDGGITAWKAAGLPVEGKQAAPEITAGEYEKMISGRMVLADFGAEWCPPCRKLAPVIAGVQQKYAATLKVVNIDGATQDKLMKAHNVSTMPTIILYKSGKEVWRADRYIAQKDLEAVINKFK
jgi:rhodanese-related sulfurtransferase